MFWTNVVEKIKTNIFFSTTFFNRSVYEIKWRNIVQPGTGHGRQYGACALHAGYLRLQTHIQDMQYLSLFLCKCGCSNAPRFYVIRESLILFNPFNAELNSICHLLALVGFDHILQVSRVRVNCNVENLSSADFEVIILKLKVSLPSEVMIFF